MERPLSAASSVTAPSTTSGPTHKRNASVRTGFKPTSSNAVSLFVTNLRLLDLDLLPDWPNITVSSFTNQDARTKIKCVEYALYQLFKLYDPATTAEKLQPFFPPLEPVQSVNLRAALFRCLNHLKKNSILTKDVVLRKTMLDECQGDRFWEACLSFSALVLRKRTLETRARRGGPLAQKLGMASSVSKSQKDSMLPLAIAHKAALTRVLSDKQHKGQTYARLHGILGEKDAELRQRKVRSQEHAQRTKRVQPEKLKSVEQAVEPNWIGSTDLRDALVNGDTCPKGDGMLLQSFDKLWRSDGDEDRIHSAGAEVGLLQSLNERVLEQNARLRRWQHFHDHLMATKPASQRTSRPASGAQKKAMRFDRHRSINLTDSPDEDEEPEPQPAPRRSRQSTTSRYDSILNTMRNELRQKSAHRNQAPAVSQTLQVPKRAQTHPVPLRKPSLALDISPGAPNPHARSPSQTAVPVRPPMGRRVSSRTRTYQAPKVDGQRQPIPLKAELFSPLKENRRGSLGPGLFPPVEDPDEPDSKVISIDWASARINGDQSSSEPASQRDSKLGIHTKGPLNGIDPNTARTILPSGEVEDDEPSQDSQMKPAPVPVEKQHSLGASVRPSLAERTRKSMAFSSSEDIKASSPQRGPDQSTVQQKEHLIELPEVEEPYDRRASLLERTRQSISMAPAPGKGPHSKKLSHNRSRTSVYPINQFETSRKAGVRRSTINGIEKEPLDPRVVTPMEKLLSPDADYDSVFKARPKIALSPVLTPCRDSDGQDTGRSSPLVGVGT